MKIKKLIALAMIPLMLTGCTLSRNDAPVVYGSEIEGLITDETSVLGISAKDMELESKLTDDTFYIVHNGVYYPVYQSLVNEVYKDTDVQDITSARTGEMMFFSTQEEGNIPTLFPGDTIVFYSTKTMLEDIYWERYYDCGYTFGLRNLIETKAGRFYLDIANKDIACVFPDTSLSEISKYEAEKVLIDKVGGVEITEASVRDGIIVGATKDQTYDFEVYTGTNYKYLTGVANFHAFKDFEIYESLEFETLREHFWEVKVPEYVVEGYYNLNHTGLFRVCKDIMFSEQTNFNEPILFPSIDMVAGSPFDSTAIYQSHDIEEFYEYTEYFEDKYYSSELRPKIYTSDESLLNNSDENWKYFSTNILGAVGYKEPENFDADPEEYTAPTYEDDPEIVKLNKASIIRYELWFPEKKKCKISIKTTESTGAAYVKFENGSKNELVFNKFDGVYETEFSGAGIKGIITISGLTRDYDIVLTNVEVYENQDGQAGLEALPEETNTEAENNEEAEE